MPPETRRQGRARRHERVREDVSGTRERPRLAVFRSLGHIYGQIVDDRSGHTLAAASDLGLTEGRKSERAKKVGAQLAERARAAGIADVVFDRGGYRYHGRVKALAEGARESGLRF